MAAWLGGGGGGGGPIVLLLLLASKCLPRLVAAGGAEAEVEEEHSWGWVGVFSLEAEEAYTWTVVRGEGGAYVESSMKLVALPVASADEVGVQAAQAQARQLWEQPLASWANASSGEQLRLGTTFGLVVHLQFDAESWLTLFTVRASASGSYAFFCEHDPKEFESGFHYFREDHGHNVEAVFQVESHHGDHDGDKEDNDHGHEEHGHEKEHEEEERRGHPRLGLAMGGAFLTTLPAMLALPLVGPRMGDVDTKAMARIFPLTSGAIAGCAFFLVLPEALHLASEGRDEVTGVWTWGVAVMLGWLACVAVHHSVSLIAPEHSHDASAVSAAGVGGAADGSSPVPATRGVATVLGVPTNLEEVELRDKAEEVPVDYAVALPVLLGDLLHNFVDGIVVGISARMCGATMTWSIVFATIAHELPQEVSDFVILVVEAKMRWQCAMLANFLAAQSAVVGAVLSHEARVSSQTQGLILGFGGGVFLFIAMSELAPRVLTLPPTRSLADSLLILLAFSVGAACIGLVLLGHEHCAAEGGEHGRHELHGH